MWDGFWFLANRRAWERLPEDIRTIVAKNINAAGIKERADVAKLNANLQQELAGKGLTFNQPDGGAVPRKAALRRLLCRVEGQIRRPGLGRCWKSPSASCRNALEPPRFVMAHVELRRPVVGEAAVSPLAASACWPRWSMSWARRRDPGGLLVVAEIVILFAGVVARYGVHRPLIWSDELASILFLWLAMLGAAVAFRRSEHMRMTAIVAVRGRPCAPIWTWSRPARRWRFWR